MLKKMFKCVELINDILTEDQILEISVKQSMMSICLSGLNVLPMEQLKIIDDISDRFSVTDITSFNDVIYIRFLNLSEDITDDIENVDECPLENLYKVIFELKELLCSCPSLEYAISSEFVKVYLDMPNIQVEDLNTVDYVFGQKSMLELNKQRAYLLYVRDW